MDNFIGMMQKLQCGGGDVMSLFSVLTLLLWITTKTWVCGTIFGSFQHLFQLLQ